ncbi:hypothetical protein WI75_25440 [Burkholderia ubonensis]|nr:hypothetical protein WI75_25440 [Burkholderia ubonensis]
MTIPLEHLGTFLAIDLLEQFAFCVCHIAICTELFYDISVVVRILAYFSTQASPQYQPPLGWLRNIEGQRPQTPDPITFLGRIKLSRRLRSLPTCALECAT